MFKKRLLYIHIPFCDSKCNYCAFNSYIDKNNLKEQYVQALIEDLKYQFEFFKVEKKSFYTLFIGGGTPSTLSIKYFEDIFKFISPYLRDDIEITTEINPTAQKEWIEGMRDFGVNRISVGVQSFDTKKLDILGRNHSSKKAISTIENIKKSNIDNISLDLIYDVCIDNKDILQNDINIATSLPITHLSSYSLSIESNTAFAKKPHMKLDNDDLAIWWIDTICANDFSPYEISNFAKEPKYECRHNKGYWSYDEYIGAGSGAIGFVGDTRYQAYKDIEKYISTPTTYEEEAIDQKDQKLEQIFLGLRSNIGVCLDVFNSKEKQRIDILTKEHKITKIENKIFNNSYLLSDEIVSFIYNR